MRRPQSVGRGDRRGSALWGSGSRGGGNRSRHGPALLTATLALVVLTSPLGARAGGGLLALPGAEVSPGLLELARTRPAERVRVIVRAPGGSAAAAQALEQAALAASVRVDIRPLQIVGAAAAEVPASVLEELARHPGLQIARDGLLRTADDDEDERPRAGRRRRDQRGSRERVRPSRIEPDDDGRRGRERDRDRDRDDDDDEDDDDDDDEEGSRPLPAIAIVDSGIEHRRDFDSRIVADVKLTTLPDGPGDTRGHGTFVAGIAAGSAREHTGAAPNAPIVSLDVMDDTGMALVSDVIAACEWILVHQAEYNIRVANFSLHAERPSSFRWDPLDRAVEKLWFSGVVVVTSVGNYGITEGPSGVVRAPANDPFVITVGAIHELEIPSWSAYGYTLDGFRKPELSAPGRFMVGPIPLGSALARDRAENLVGRGYIKLSGTSFAAPLVAGTAAQLLGRFPHWTPGQVKGALMVSAKPVSSFPSGAGGVGEVSASRAARVTNPPNPNAALERWLVPDPSGGAGSIFDVEAWGVAAHSDPAWDSAAWSDAAWSDAAWSSAAWSDAAWSDAAWSDAAWSDAAWADAAWADAARANG